MDIAANIMVIYLSLLIFIRFIYVRFVIAIFFNCFIFSATSLIL